MVEKVVSVEIIIINKTNYTILYHNYIKRKNLSVKKKI